MADSSVKSAKKKKRKLTSDQEKIRPTKNRRANLREEVGVEPDPKLEENEPARVEVDGQKLQEERPWRNLKLILSIQNKEIDLQKKVELVFSFVNSRVKGGFSDNNEDYETVKTSRLIVFLNDWVQSLLISTEKKVKVYGGRNQSGVIDGCLDFRCWVIFKFCLEESLKWHVSLSISRNLLRAISCIARNALSLLNGKNSHLKESLFVGEGFELYNIALDCISLVFSSQGGLLNENLDLWISTVDPILELVLKIHSQSTDGGCTYAFVLQFSCLVLEPFAKFLRIHPTRKNGFRDFVDKLLEPLLHLLGILHCQIDPSHPGQTRNLEKLVEEVLSNGLFHPTHIDGFLGLRGTERYIASHEGNLGDSKTIIKSYHRHLFDKLENIMAAKKVSVLSGIGQLFHLLVDRVSKQKGASVFSEAAKLTGKIGASMLLEKDVLGHVSVDSFGSSSARTDKSYFLSNLNAEARKSLFEFFIQIMEPLLFEMNEYVQAKLVGGPTLLDVHCTLKSINSLLASFMHEKVYVRTEDISEGACLNFLMKVHGVVMSLASNLPQLLNFDLPNGTEKEMFTYLAKELLAAVGYLLDIEYEVIGHDLESLWLMMLSYLGIGLSFVDSPNQCSLTIQIVYLGCQLVNLYSELRQVNNIVFALCKAVRLLISCENKGETSYIGFMYRMNSLPYEAYAKSVEVLLCSQEFKLSFHNAIRSIPEGQASGCIRQLTADISESMKWMKENCAAGHGKEFNLKVKDFNALCFDLQAELLGRDLSEIYVLLLDSLTVTTGNSNLVGLSIKDLMNIICPFISTLVKLQPESVNEFFFSFSGITFENGMAGNNNNLLKCRVSVQWVFVFFFRLYLSCRSLYRQAVNLMPPDTSRTMSAEMGDSLMAFSGKDWMEKSDWTNEGYFSWVVQPSISLIDVIQFVSDNYIKDNISKCCPLIYVLHAMALQRLVDLNRQIKSLGYLLQNNDKVIQIKLLGLSDLSQYRKKTKKWRRCISVLNQEAAGLTEFMMGYVSLVIDMQLVISSSDDVSCVDKCAQELHRSNDWNMSVCTVDEKSFPTAIWWIVSNNIDIWCTHAASKKLKKFLSLLIHTSLPCVTHHFCSIGKHNSKEAGCLKKVTVHQISYELLSDSFLYEHKFVRRHLASRFCHLLEQTALSLFSDFSITDVDFSTSPNWSKVLSELENSLQAVSGTEKVTIDSFSVAKSISHSFDKLPTAVGKGKRDFQFASTKFTACHSLLNLLCWMPKGYLNTRSFSLYMTYILNLERIVVGCLLQCQDALLSCSLYDFFRLFASCRRTLKYIIMACCEEKTEFSQSSPILMLSEGSDFVLWLFNSVFLVIGLQEALSNDCCCEIRDMIFYLIDHTSYIFLTLSNYHSNSAINSFILFEEPGKEKPSSEVSHDQNNLKENGPCLDSSKGFEGWKSMFLVMESLEEQAQSLLMSLKDALCDTKVKVCSEEVNLNRLSSLISCFSGIFWGLASAMNNSDEKDSDKVKLLRWKCEPISKVNHYINVFADNISSFLSILVVEDDQPPGSSCNAQKSQKLDCCRDPFDSREFLLERCNAMSKSSCGKLCQSLGTLRTCISSFDIDDNSMAGGYNNRSQLDEAKCPATVLAEDDLIEVQFFNRHLLHGLLNGDHPEVAFCLRQLLMASSAILRLNLQRSNTPFSSSLVPTFIGISEFLLLHLADMIKVPQPFTFFWLDGVLRYLEELGSHFPITNPMLTRNVFTKLIELHLKAIGKCASLQGKKATLASHETESSTKLLDGSTGFSEASLSHRPYYLDEFKARLRMSFKAFIKKPSDLHLLSAVQAIERALVGVQEGCTMIYNISTGGGDGGKVSSVVVAGIDCLDLVLEHVSGRKRLGVIKRHIQNFIAALFNVILHLQSPLIFFEKPTSSEDDNGPDPGSVILMCIQVLTRISGKHALFQMDSWHIAQSIRIPAALFQDFLQLRLPQASVPSTSAMFLDNQNSNHMVSQNSGAVDRQFSINLFAACCKLLYTIVKHHKSECERCIALLEESVRVLLHCLETVDTDLVVRKGSFSWAVQEAVKCACFLRRIYEEVRQQKDVFGQHCFKFLSNYIWIYSGYGPLKTGFRREIDEALRPGVYALIDACSADDLQYLHTVFGEGPCRNTLATLQHEYKRDFRYEGKV